MMNQEELEYFKNQKLQNKFSKILLFMKFYVKILAIIYIKIILFVILNLKFSINIIKKEVKFNMNLGDFNIKDLRKNSISNNPITNFVSNFVIELSNYLQNNQKSNNSNERNDKFNKEIKEYYDEREKIRNTTMLEDDKIYVLSGIYDNKLQVVDIENGDEIEIYVSTGDDSLDRFKSSDIYNRTYTMDRAEFLNLRLTDNVILHDGNLNTNTDKVEIKNNLAWRLLADLYESIKTTNGKEYKVADIKDNEIYLTNADGSGGYFSIYKELYPHFEIGDTVQRNDRIYRKVE